MAGVSVRFGRPRGTERLAALVGVQMTESLAQQVVQRVQKRVDHPAAQSLRAQSVNQHRAMVTGPRGGPGIIRPVRAKALRFVWHGQVVFAKSVNSAGLLPLIIAEGERISQADADEIIRRIDI